MYIRIIKLLLPVASLQAVLVIYHTLCTMGLFETLALTALQVHTNTSFIFTRYRRIRTGCLTFLLVLLAVSLKDLISLWHFSIHLLHVVLSSIQRKVVLGLDHKHILNTLFLWVCQFHYTHSTEHTQYSWALPIPNACLSLYNALQGFTGA